MGRKENQLCLLWTDDHEQISDFKVEGEDSAKSMHVRSATGILRLLIRDALIKVPAPELLGFKDDSFGLHCTGKGVRSKGGLMNRIKR